jgi:assimilatory nitrate reductase catalytic subunit
VQWPFPEGSESAERERRLFADGRFFHADGRAKFVIGDPRPLPESPCTEYPLLLLTGRGSAAQWHTQSRTRKSSVLRKLAPTGLHVEIHPDDAAQLGVEPNTDVRVESRRGSIVARALITATIRPGQIFLPMHESATNQLTFPAFDPYSRQPAYKACAVRVRVQR